MSQEEHTASAAEPNTYQFAILAFPGFPMMAFSAVIEPLRAVNELEGRRVYDWMIVANEPGPVTASNGVSVEPRYIAESAPNVDFIVVCSGGDADKLVARSPLNWIRRCLRNGGRIGSVADGAFYLARTGLLDGYRCTLHWRSQPAFKEAFPHIELEQQIYVIDRTRFTSAGGVSAFDMMLDIIEGHCGDTVRRGVAEWFVHDTIRATADREKLQLRLRTGIRDDLVLAAAGEMEDRMEFAEPLSVIADRLGVSVARLERAFHRELHLTPAEYFRRMRMQRARDLIEHSSMPIREIGLACGYSSFSSFIRAYRSTFGETPR